MIVTLASQVQEGSTIEGSLSILGTNGQQMTPPSAILVKHKADSRISVKLSANSPLNFVVTGVSLGDAELEFIVDDVRSQPTSVYVFPPIKVINFQPNKYIFIHILFRLKLLNYNVDNFKSQNFNL